MGLPSDHKERAARWGLAADAAGLQLSIHAIGDRAISDVLDLFERVERTNGRRDRRPRIEHDQHTHAARLRAARAAGRDRVGAALPRHRRRPLRGEADRPAAHAEHVRLPQLPGRGRAHWPSAPTGRWRRSIPILGHRRRREPADARRQEPRAAGTRSRRSRWRRRSAPTPWTTPTPPSWRTVPARSPRANTPTSCSSTATCWRCRRPRSRTRRWT